MSPWRLLALRMLLLRSRALRWKRFAKRESTVVIYLGYLLIDDSAWNNSIRMFGLGERSL